MRSITKSNLSLLIVLICYVTVAASPVWLWGDTNRAVNMYDQFSHQIVTVPKDTTVICYEFALHREQYSALCNLTLYQPVRFYHGWIPFHAITWRRGEQ